MTTETKTVVRISISWYDENLEEYWHAEIEFSDGSTTSGDVNNWHTLPGDSGRTALQEAVVDLAYQHGVAIRDDQVVVWPDELMAEWISEDSNA